MKPCSKTRSDKSTCANISRTYVNYLMTALSWNECIIMLLIIHWLLCIDYLWLYTYNSDTTAGAEFISSHRSVLKNFANFTEKHLCWGLLFTKLLTFRAATLLKKGPNTGVFLWNLRNSEEHLFWRTSERLLLWIDYFIIYWFL